MQSVYLRSKQAAESDHSICNNMWTKGDIWLREGVQLRGIIRERERKDHGRDVKPHLGHGGGKPNTFCTNTEGSPFGR